jgi:hypothetical protein
MPVHDEDKSKYSLLSPTPLQRHKSYISIAWDNDMWVERKLAWDILIYLRILLTRHNSKSFCTVSLVDRPITAYLSKHYRHISPLGENNEEITTGENNSKNRLITILEEETKCGPFQL